MIGAVFIFLGAILLFVVWTNLCCDYHPNGDAATKATGLTGLTLVGLGLLLNFLFPVS